MNISVAQRSGIKLSELTKEIYEVINSHFADKFFWVIAEVTNHRYVSKSGYHYFDLAEKDSNNQAILTKISCTAFSTGSESVRNFESYTKQKFTNNLEVLVKLKIDYNPAFGLKAILYDIDVAFTIGNLEKIRQQTLLRLLKEESQHIKKIGDDYWTTNKALALPIIVKNVALITSKNSEAYTDFCHTITNNDYGYRINVLPFLCKVQAETASQEIIECLKKIFSDYKGLVDGVVICRGGGSQTDFLTFDNFNLCRTIARFPIPIVTGIGHQTNRSIADLLVRVETKTPTKAAEFIINHCHNAELNVRQLQKQIIFNSQKIILNQSNRLSDLRSTVINCTRDSIATCKESLQNSRSQIIANSNRIISSNKDQIAHIHKVFIGNTYRLMNLHKQELYMLATVLTTRPPAIISNQKNDLMNEIKKLKSSSSMFVKLKLGYIGHYRTLFKHLSVDNILSKGFAIIRKGGEIVTDPSLIQVHDDINIQLKNTSLNSKITDKKDGTEFNL